MQKEDLTGHIVIGKRQLCLWVIACAATIAMIACVAIEAQDTRQQCTCAISKAS